MKNITTNPEQEIVNESSYGDALPVVLEAERESAIVTLRTLWNARRILGRFAFYGLILGIVVAFAIPARYTSTTRLMPPDQQTGSGLSMLASLAGGSEEGIGGGSLGALAGDLLGVKTTGDLFIGILSSRTVQDDLITKFDLRNVYWDRRWEEARIDLATRTNLAEDRKSGIITIQVTDRSRERAAAMAREYVEKLNYVVNLLSTSSAHRERVFLEERLAGVKQDLESAEKEFSQFASKNTAIDIQSQGKAMVEAAATLRAN